MTYKDKDKQREADRERQRRYRAERGRQAYPKGVTGCDKQGVTKQGVTGQGVTPNLGQAGTPDLGQAGTQGMTDERSNVKLIAPPILEPKVKRGKDIKVFADLPPAAQLAVKELSDTDEEFKRRTAIAINYQHLFPDRFHSTGIAI